MGFTTSRKRSHCGLGRRDVLGLAAGGAAGLCMFRVPAVLAQEANATYFTWSGYEIPEFHGAYLEQHGVSPDVTFFADEDEAITKLRSGFVADVVHPCASALNLWRDNDLIRPIDTSRLTYWDEIFPSIREIPGVQDDDGVWMMPFDWGNSSLIVRTDLIAPEDAGRFADVLLNPAYRGRIAIPDMPMEVAAIGGLLTDIQDPFNMSDSDFATWRDVMTSVNDNVLFYWSDPTTMEQALASGEIVAGWGWNSSVASLQAEGVPVAYVTDAQEGIMTWVCGLSLLAGGSGDDSRAYDLLNAFGSPVAGKNLIELYGFGAANAVSFEIADPAAVAALGFSDASAFLNSGLFFSAMPGPLREEVASELDAIKAGS